MGNFKRKRILGLTMLTAAAVLGGTAAALWISGMLFTGSLTVVGGVEPSAELYTWNVDLNVSEALNDSQDFVYSNPDGMQTFLVGIDTSGITSTAPNCVYQEDEDLIFFVVWTDESEITTSSHVSESATPSIQIQPGDNTLTITTQGNPNSCPLSGTIAMTMTLNE